MNIRKKTETQHQTPASFGVWWGPIAISGECCGLKRVQFAVGVSIGDDLFLESLELGSF
jgi:hypothetical protein